MFTKNHDLEKIFGKIEIETILKKIHGKKLKQTERNYLSRSIRPKLRAAAFLTKQDFLSAINTIQKKNTSLIVYNLNEYGFPLFALNRKKTKKMQIEELIIEILIQYPSPRFIEAIPILLLKNKIDPFRLLELASLHEAKNQLGYLIETAYLIRKKKELASLLTYLKKNKEKENKYLSQGDYKFLLETSPPRIRKWNLLGRFFDDDFKKLAQVYL